MILAVITVFSMFSCDLMMDGNETGEMNNGTVNNGTAGNNNAGNGNNNGANGTDNKSGSIYGNYRLGEDTYEYKNDGYVYKNGTKTNKFSVLENGKLRLFNSMNDSDGYKDYDYTVGEDGLVFGDWNYSKIEAGTTK